MNQRSRLDVFFWSSLILLISQALAFCVASREMAFLEANPQIIPPQVSFELPLAYFFGAVIVLGVVLFLIPISKLRLALRILFVALYSWGIFIVLALSLPFVLVVLISVAAGLVWFFSPRVWLHNLVMILTLVSVGSVFGLLLSPWTTLILLLAISIYDILAVRFGYMMWMAKKLSESDVLPAFIIPKTLSGWNLSLRGGGFKKVIEGESAEREFSILGGGDVGFPLVLIVSVFATYGFTRSLVVAAFSVVGLIGAYWIQRFFLKGKPMPAIPPISFACLIGFLIVRFI